jgi:hypothetical protein
VIASRSSAYGAIIQANPPPALTPSPGGPNRFASWDVNGDGTMDRLFIDQYPNTPPQDTGIIWQMSTMVLGSNEVVGYDGPFVSADHRNQVAAATAPTPRHSEAATDHVFA